MRNIRETSDEVNHTRIPVKVHLSLV